LLPRKIRYWKTTYEYGLEEDKYPDAKYFVIDKLKTQRLEEIQPKDVVLYGFGRIGRLLPEN
jgi:glyceraldehyde 3-phosphate dehydrogenase